MAICKLRAAFKLKKILQRREIFGMIFSINLNGYQEIKEKSLCFYTHYFHEPSLRGYLASI